jgi:undecaprenyl-diphosphatase
VLGIIQGLTEFIPVSSTAHLILAPEVFGIAPLRDDIAHTYDTFIQIGTVLPVLLYFWRDWLKIIAAGWRVVRHWSVANDPDERMAVCLMVGSVPAGAAGLLLEKHVELLAQPQRFPPAYLCIGGALVLVGILMWVVENAGRKSREIEHLRWPDALLMGIAQAVAIWPGVSRSGATMTAGLMLGLTREAAARFSFLMMAPIMVAAAGYKATKIIGGHEHLTAGEWAGMLLATAVAAVTGYVAIAFLLRWLRTRTLAFFSAYRIVLGAFVIGLYFLQR